jgi:hypothetical protein
MPFRVIKGNEPNLMRRPVFVIAIFLLARPAFPAIFRLRKPAGAGGGNITLRKRLHINTLITEPGTAELDWGGLYSVSTTAFTMPAALKYTPQGTHIFWGRSEYAIAFDSITNNRTTVGRATQFSQSITLTATAVLHDGDKLDIALAPVAAFFLRDEAGARLGAVAIARYDTGKSSIGGSFAWTGATHSSDSNPAGTSDLGFGFGRRLAAGGLLGKFTSHLNALAERSTGQRTIVSTFEGVECQITDQLAFDLSGQNIAIRGGTLDNQIVFGITYNFGKSH